MDIREAKNKLLDADEIEITCVISQGKRQGELYKRTVRYGAPNGHERNLAPKVKNTEGVTFRGNRKIGLHVENATVPLTDVSDNSYLSPKWSHIIEIGGVKIYR